MFDDHYPNDYPQIYIPLTPHYLPHIITKDEFPDNNNYNKSISNLMYESEDSLHFPITIEENEDLEIPIFDEDKKKSSTISKMTDETITINNETKKDKYFPFKKGKGLRKYLAKCGLIANHIKSKKINKIKYYTTKYIFKTIIYENGKIKKKESKKRPDLIRKKIRTKFYRSLLNIINNRLKKAGYKKKFEYFPQSFITNMNKEINKKSLNLTFEQLIVDIEKFGIKDEEKTKIIKNIQILNDLKENHGICKMSEFDIIKSMTLTGLFIAYFLSNQFERSIKNFKKNKLYMEDYVNIALTYVKYYSDNKDFNDMDIIPYDNEEED